MFAQVLKAPAPDEVKITAYKQTCDGCRWRIDGITCDAFPDGIPAAILLGVFDHTHHYEGPDGDDNGITFATETV